MAYLEFTGKRFVQNYHLTVPHRKLEIDKKKSLTDKPGLDDNIIVHGDNLEALKSLMPHFAGKVKCIYIDPPYNTGSEGWVYSDNVNSENIKAWIGQKVDKDVSDRHDRWLCMMMPRLRLLKDLLRDDGVIFISIDDNELCRLTLLMDEIFGEQNYRNLIVIRRGVKSVQAQFQTVDRLSYGVEYVLCYSKASDFRFPNLRIERDDATEGGWNNHWRGTDRKRMRYELFGITPKTGQWRWSRARSLDAIDNYKQLLKDLGKKKGQTPSTLEVAQWWQQKQKEGEELDLLRLSENDKPEHYIAPSDSILASSNWNDLKPNGSHQLKAIFGKKVFDNPKSTDLIQRLLKFAGVADGDIVLDSYAGSGTTGQATLEYSLDLEIRTQFILVQCDERDPNTSEQKDITNSITAERMRRVIHELDGNPSASFTYYELGESFDEEKFLSGKNLPSYEDMAGFVWSTLTGASIDEKKIKEKKQYIGETDKFEVYLIYEPDLERLKKDVALTFDWLKKLPQWNGNKKRLVFAPVKWMSSDVLYPFGVEYVQLPYEIYRRIEPK